MDRLTTYAVVLGRATACGVDTSVGAQRVGAWMDRVMPPGSADQRTFLPIFVEGTQMHARRQASGQSPDTCAQVRTTYARMVWP